MMRARARSSMPPCSRGSGACSASCPARLFNSWRKCSNRSPGAIESRSASSRCIVSICSSAAVWPPVAAAASSDSSRSVIPESAECTTTGRRPSATRSRSTRAMLCQLAGVDTLVPPNFSTTQGWRSLDTGTRALSVRLRRTGAGQSIVSREFNRLRKCRAALFPTGVRPRRPPPGSRRLCRVCRRRRFGAPFGAFQQRIEIMRFFGFAEKLIVDIEMFVFAFAHFREKPLKSIGSNRLVHEAAHYSRFCIAFNYQAERHRQPRHSGLPSRFQGAARSLIFQYLALKHGPSCCAAASDARTASGPAITSRCAHSRTGPAVRSWAIARFTAERMARSEAVMIFGCIPAPNRVRRDRVVISI